MKIQKQKILLVFLLFALIGQIFGIGIIAKVEAVHDVPPYKQPGPKDCAPAAAASCLKWFQKNGYPNLKTREPDELCGCGLWEKHKTDIENFFRRQKEGRP